MIATTWTKPTPVPGGALPTRTADWMALTRPRLALLGLIVVVLSYGIAGAIDPKPWQLTTLVVGALLALSGASALNQAIEITADRQMRRTADRPVPSGRIGRAGAAAFGLTLVAIGIVMLARINMQTAGWAAAGVLSYVLVYTPLKSKTSLSTVIGAVPGAIPTLMGWAAATGSLSATAWSLFWILFLWQMPHFLAVAWMYRLDYARAGFRMLPDVDADGDAATWQVLAYGAALVPVSLLPSMIGPAGPGYFIGAVLLGAAYLGFGLQLKRTRSGTAARALLRASVIYLPLLLGLLALDVLAL